MGKAKFLMFLLGLDVVFRFIWLILVKFWFIVDLNMEKGIIIS